MPSWTFENTEIQDDGSKMAAILAIMTLITRHMTPSLPVADIKEYIFGRTIYLTNPIGVALIAVRLWRGEGRNPLSRSEKTKLKPLLDRVEDAHVKICLQWQHWVTWNLTCHTTSFPGRCPKKWRSFWRGLFKYYVLIIKTEGSRSSSTLLTRECAHAQRTIYLCVGKLLLARSLEQS